MICCATGKYVCGLQEVRFKNEGVKFLHGGQKIRYKMYWKGGKEGQNEVGMESKRNG